MIDPEFLDELDHFDAELKRRVTDVFAGEQESTMVGEGRTFSDYRRYVPGDDTRLIDWKLYGRTDELFVKQFERERNLTMHLLVDASGSMEFGEGETNKFDYAAKIALGFAYLAVAENNDFRFSIFQDEAERLDTGRSNHGEVLRLVDRCNEVEPTESADFATALSGYQSAIRSRSLVVVASDFLDDPDAIDAGLAPLARNEVVLAHVIAPDERDPPVSGDTIFRALEDQIRRRTYFGSTLRRRYQERLQAHVDAVAARSRDVGATHVLVDTGEDFFESFVRTWFA